MLKHHKKLLDNLDTLMLTLTTHKELRLDGEVIRALKALAKSRNAFKRKYNASLAGLTRNNGIALDDFRDPEEAARIETLKRLVLDQMASTCR
jgi:hypothetical protein